MSTTLSVAAGGGGDALAALIVDHVLNPTSSREQIVASYSWDRHLIDPTPGPRTVHDFTGLVPRGGNVWEVTPRSRLLTGGVSGLSILARHTDARFFLLDPTGGAAGLQEQTGEIAAYISASAVTLVDVGGDIAARGDETELLSPLADALALAAVAGLSCESEVIVAGPGLDGELSEAYVRARLAAAGATHRRISSRDVKSYTAALDHHPSEATALLAASALGIEGRAEIRDKAALVPLHAASADLLIADCGAVFKRNDLAGRLAATRTFAAAEHAVKEICGRTELDHERAKAAAALTNTRHREPTPEELQDRIRVYRTSASERGVNLVSFRRLAETIGLPTYDPALIRAAVGQLAYDDVPLCRV